MEQTPHVAAIGYRAIKKIVTFLTQPENITVPKYAIHAIETHQQLLQSLTNYLIKK